MEKTLIIRPKDRDEWLRQRKLGVGASDLGVLAGVSHFRTPIDLWRDKMGLVPVEPENSVQANGHEMEPAVALLWANRSGDIMDPTSEGDWMAIDAEKPWLRVSPDRVFYPKGTPENQRGYANGYLLECKTINGTATPDNYPLSWFFQVQYQMGVMRVKKAVIGWIATGPRLGFGYVEVPFNPGVYAEIVRIATEFWKNNVEAGVMPDVVLNGSDANFRWPDEINEMLLADADIENRCEKYRALSAQKSDLEKEMDEIKLDVKIFMKDRAELRSSDGKKTLATWRNNAKNVRTLRFV